MLKDALYLLFGLAVLGTYAYTAHSGFVFSSAAKTPAPPGLRASGAGVRAHPTFWSSGYQGGK